MIDERTSLDRGTRPEKTFALRMIEWADPDSLRERPRGALRGSPLPHRAPEDPVQSFQTAVAAALSALADQPIATSFEGHSASFDGAKAHLPKLPRAPTSRDVDELRGIADGFALAARLSNKTLHDRLRPADAASAQLFDLFERMRCAALGARLWPGTARNLAAAADLQIASRGLATSAPPVDLALEAVLASALAGLDLASAATLPRWRAWIDTLHPMDIGALEAALADQRSFAGLVLPIVRALAPYLQPTALPKPKPSPKESGERPTEIADASAESRPETPASASPDKPGDQYRAFTTAHDRVVGADEIVPPAEQADLRRKLDAAGGDDRRAATRLANRLQRYLKVLQTRAWDFDLEEGLLDAARLTRVVNNPAAPLSFKLERPSPFRDTVVGLLVDNSGSMRGRPILTATLAADVLTRALELASVKTEVLGYTTRSVRGGASGRDWIEAGRPDRPGRLGDLLHIVYKDATTPYRRARNRLAAALKPDLLKENVDGEALLWAEARLLARPEPRRVLIVLSDGEPSEVATAAANGPTYLARHLGRVVTAIEARGLVELRAIGIGFPVDRFYRRSVVLEDDAGIVRALAEQLESVFSADPLAHPRV